MVKKPPCLILDKRYYPNLIVNYKKAFLMSLRENNQVLEYHPNEYLHTVHKSYNCPVIIRIDEAIDYKQLYVTPSRRLIFIRDDYTCQYCGKPLSERNATIDHVYPKSKGGTWSWTNLVTACESCNQLKGNRTLEESRMELIRNPYHPEPFIVTFKHTVKTLDLTTFDIWLNYLPIKLKKIAIDIRKNIEQKVK